MAKITPQTATAKVFDTVQALPEPERAAFWEMGSEQEQTAYLHGLEAAQAAQHAAAEKPAPEPVTPSRPVRL